MAANPIFASLSESPSGTSAPTRGYPVDTQLGWLVRYVPIKAYLTGAALNSLIEVGSGARGLATILEDAPFVAIDVRIDGEPAPSMYPFSYDAGRVPFRSGAFHTVVSMDTLEHVPPANRVDFIKELLRISASRVILGFPAHNPQVDGDKLMRDLFGKLGMGAPGWLNEHDEFGLPPAREVEAILSQLDDWSWRALPATGDFVNLLATLGDIVPGARAMIQPVLENHAARVQEWLLAGVFGPATRKVYLIERRRPLVPIVDLDQPATLIAAISCPNCEGDTRVAPPGVSCPGCGAVFAPDGQGVFRLHRSTIAPGAVNAVAGGAALGITFALTPDWAGPEWLLAVHNYLHAFAGGEPHRLWVTADPRVTGLDLAGVLQQLRPLLLPFGERPFAEIFLSETPPAPGTALPLTSDRARVHEYTSEWFRGQAQAAAPPRPRDPTGAKVYW